CGYRFDTVAINGVSLHEMDDWSAFNLSPDQTIRLHHACLQELGNAVDRSWQEKMLHELETRRVEALGMSEFMRRYPDIATPCLMVPVTAHYSWPKAMKLLGLGSAPIVSIPGPRMRLDTAGLAAALHEAEQTRTPVLGAVGVTGTTEFGTIDPIHEMAELRDSRAAAGQGFGLHVDAAWGGYLTSIFREPDGSLRSHAAVKRDFRYFPSPEVYGAFAALA